MCTRSPESHHKLKAWPGVLHNRIQMTIWEWLNMHQMLIPPLRRTVELISEPCSLMLHMIWPVEQQQQRQQQWCSSCVCCISCVSAPKMEGMTLITQQHAWLDLTGIERSCYECAFLDDTVVTGLELMTTGPLDVSLQPHSHWSQVCPPSEVGGSNIWPHVYTVYILFRINLHKNVHTYPTSCIYLIHLRKAKYFHQKISQSKISN